MRTIIFRGGPEVRKRGVTPRIQLAAHTAAREKPCLRETEPPAERRRKR
jgi:hypothetical protein